jgi:hypothetical protein
VGAKRTRVLIGRFTIVKQILFSPTPVLFSALCVSQRTWGIVIYAGRWLPRPNGKWLKQIHRPRYSPTLVTSSECQRQPNVESNVRSLMHASQRHLYRPPPGPNGMRLRVPTVPLPYTNPHAVMETTLSAAHSRVRTIQDSLDLWKAIESVPPAPKSVPPAPKSVTLPSDSQSLAGKDFMHTISRSSILSREETVRRRVLIAKCGHFQGLIHLSSRPICLARFLVPQRSFCPSVSTVRLLHCTSIPFHSYRNRRSIHEDRVPF